DQIGHLVLVKGEVMTPGQVEQDAGRLFGSAERQRLLAECLPIELGFEFMRHRTRQRLAVLHVIPRAKGNPCLSGGVHEDVLIDFAEREKFGKAVLVRALEPDRLAVESQCGFDSWAIERRDQVLDVRVSQELEMQWKNRIRQAGIVKPAKQIGAG